MKVARPWKSLVSPEVVVQEVGTNIDEPLRRRKPFWYGTGFIREPGDASRERHCRSSAIERPSSACREWTGPADPVQVDESASLDDGCTRRRRTSFQASLEPMALERAASGEPIDLRRACCTPEHERSRALYKPEHLEIVLLHLAAGRALPTHRVRGDITIQCLEGCVAIELETERPVLHAGTMLCLDRMQLHALRALQASAVLVTIRRVTRRPRTRM